MLILLAKRHNKLEIFSESLVKYSIIVKHVSSVGKSWLVQLLPVVCSVSLNTWPQTSNLMSLYHSLPISRICLLIACNSCGFYKRYMSHTRKPSYNTRFIIKLIKRLLTFNFFSVNNYIILFRCKYIQILWEKCNSEDILIYGYFLLN